KGVATESVDGGFHWREVDLPPDLDDQTRPNASSSERAEQGCSPVGCAFSTWMRIGWSKQAERSRLSVAEAPPPTRRSTLGGASWVIRDCAATGESSAASRATSLPQTPRLPRLSFGRLSPAAEDEASEWRAF